MRYSPAAVDLTAVGGVTMALAAIVLVSRQEGRRRPNTVETERLRLKSSLLSTSMLTFSSMVTAVVQQNVGLMKQTKAKHVEFKAENHVV